MDRALTPKIVVTENTIQHFQQRPPSFEEEQAVVTFVSF